MKKLFLIIFLTSAFLQAKTESKVMTFPELEQFAQKTLDEKKDLKETEKAVLTLLEFDKDDPSRTAVMVLSQSYSKNKNLYDRAIKAVETKANKKQLGEIKAILAQFYKNGNG